MYLNLSSEGLKEGKTLILERRGCFIRNGYLLSIIDILFISEINYFLNMSATIKG